MPNRLRTLGVAIASAASALASVIALPSAAVAGPAAPVDCSAKPYFLTLNANLYCADALDNSWSITGSGSAMNGSAYNAFDGYVYTFKYGTYDLYKVNPNGGTQTFVRTQSDLTTLMGGHPVLGADINSRDGLMYASDAIGRNLVKIDLASGAVTDVTSLLPADLPMGQDIAILKNVLWTATVKAGVGRIYSVDLSTGAHASYPDDAASVSGALWRIGTDGLAFRVNSTEAIHTALDLSSGSPVFAVGATDSLPVAALDGATAWSLLPTDIAAPNNDKARSLDVSWSKSTTVSNSDLSGYVVDAYDHTGALAGTCSYTIDVDTGNTCTVTGLVGGQSYTVKITATNVGGQSQTTDAAGPFLAVDVPDAPTISGATAHSGGVDLSWTDGSSNGAATSGYSVYVYDHSGTLVKTKTGCTGSPCTVGGLVNGASYTFKVSQTNAVGEGPTSDASSAIEVFGPPSAPLHLYESQSTGSNVSVSFDPPADDGGSPIISYRLDFKNGATLLGHCDITLPGSATCVADKPGNTANFIATGCTVNPSGTPLVTCSFGHLHSGNRYTASATASNKGYTGPAATTDVVTGGLACVAGDVYAVVNGTMLSSDGSDYSSWSSYGGASRPAQINALSYDPVDHFLYAMRTSASARTHLVRINDAGRRTDLGPVSGLPDKQFIAGAFSADGTFYVAHGSEKLYAIDVHALTATVAGTSTSPFGTDLVINGRTAFTLLYGSLVSFDLDSGVTTSWTVPKAFAHDSSGLALTSDGSILVVSNRPKKLELISNPGPSASYGWVSSANAILQGPGQGDAASCWPASIS